MLHAVLNKSWKQHPTKQQLYDHLLPILKTFLESQARHTGHCRRSKDEHISNVLLWTSIHGHTSLGRSAKTFIYQLWKYWWCKNCHFRKWQWWSKTKPWIRCLHFTEYLYPQEIFVSNYSHSTMSKWLGRLGFLILVWQLVLEKENPEFKTVKLWPCHILLLCRGWVNTYNHQLCADTGHRLED